MSPFYSRRAKSVWSSRTTSVSIRPLLLVLSAAAAAAAAAARLSQRFLPRCLAAPCADECSSWREAALAGTDALVFFEAPHRIADTIRDLASLTERRVLVARELTKKFETITVASATELVALDIEPRGEFVLIVEAGHRLEQSTVDMGRAMRVLLTHLSPSQAAKCAATLFDQKKSVMYELALRLNNGD